MISPDHVLYYKQLVFAPRAPQPPIEDLVLITVFLTPPAFSVKIDKGKINFLYYDCNLEGYTTQQLTIVQILIFLNLSIPAFQPIQAFSPVEVC